jgi:hypothetical protein
MDQISRPVQVLLAVTLLLAALWFVALRPKSSAGGEAASAPAPAVQTTPAPSSGAAPGVEGLKRAIDKAHGAVATANGDAARAEHSTADASAPAPASAPAAVPERAAKPHAPRGAAPAHHHAASPQVRGVKNALRHHKAVAIAFVDPHTADARAVAQEIRHVSHFGGRAVTLAIPLAKLSDYDFITSKVEITVAPTVVIVDRRRGAITIVGFADRGEIEQRLADALVAKRKRR